MSHTDMVYVCPVQGILKSTKNEFCFEMHTWTEHNLCELISEVNVLLN